MEKLFKILFTHSSSKSIAEGVKQYIITGTEEQVYKFIDEKYNYKCWIDKEDENEMHDIYDEDYNVVGSQTFKEKIMNLKGEMNDEDYDFSDSYYGITLYGWEYVKDLDDNEVNTLIKIGIAELV